MILLRVYARIIRNKNFLKLWTSQILSQPAGHILNFALVIIIFELTRSSFWVSMVVALISVPPILFSAYAGVLADSRNRKAILVTSNALRVLVVLLFLFFLESPLAILVMVFIFSTISQFFGPAEISSIPELVRQKRLFTANSLFLITVYTSFFIGYSLAGPALFNLEERATFIIIAVLYLLATIANVLLPPLDKHLRMLKEEEVLEKGFRLLKKRLFEGVNYIKGNKMILFTVLQITFVFSIERSLIALAPELADKILGFNIQEISYYLVTPLAFGALIGSFVVNKIKNIFPKRKIINTGIVIDGLVLILLPLVAYNFIASQYIIPYVIFLAFMSGLADVNILITAQTILHQEVGTDTRGRVFGNLYTLMNLIGLPFILMIGWLANVISVAFIIIVLGILTLFAAAASWLIYAKKEV